MGLENLALFGATGKTGMPFLKKALVKGYRVKVLVRNPEKLSIRHENLQIIKGDILSLKDIETTVCEADAVVNLSGHVKGSPADLQSRSTELIIQAMNKFGIKRLISLTGGGVRDRVKDRPKLLDKLIVFILKNLSGKETRDILEDGIAHAEIIKKSNLNWTIVRAPVLTLEPSKGGLQVGSVGSVKGLKLTREDLAAFILDCLEKNKYFGEMPFVVN